MCSLMQADSRGYCSHREHRRFEAAQVPASEAPTENAQTCAQKLCVTQIKQRYTRLNSINDACLVSRFVNRFSMFWPMMDQQPAKPWHGDLHARRISHAARRIVGFATAWPHFDRHSLVARLVTSAWPLTGPPVGVYRSSESAILADERLCLGTPRTHFMGSTASPPRWCSGLAATFLVVTVVLRSLFSRAQTTSKRPRQSIIAKKDLTMFVAIRWDSSRGLCGSRVAEYSAHVAWRLLYL